MQSHVSHRNINTVKLKKSDESRLPLYWHFLVIATGVYLGGAFASKFHVSFFFFLINKLLEVRSCRGVGHSRTRRPRRPRLPVIRRSRVLPRGQAGTRQALTGHFLSSLGARRSRQSEPRGSPDTAWTPRRPPPHRKRSHVRVPVPCRPSPQGATRTPLVSLQRGPQGVWTPTRGQLPVLLQTKSFLMHDFHIRLAAGCLVVIGGERRQLGRAPEPPAGSARTGTQ